MAGTSPYSEETKREAALQLLIHGSLSKASEFSGVPDSTIQSWTESDWWDSMLGQVRSIAAVHVEAHVTKHLKASLDHIADRLENGDTVMTRNGPVQVPARLRDVAFTFSVLFDKRQIMMHRPTSISGHSHGELGDGLSAWLKAQRGRLIEGEGHSLSAESEGNADVLSAQIDVSSNG